MKTMREDEKRLRLVQYTDEYDEQIEKLDQLMFWKIKFHPDLIRETVYLVVEEKNLVGVAYLIKRSGFIHIDQNLAYHEIILENYIEAEAANPGEIMSLLLEQMKIECDRISADYPGKRIFIKCWAPEEEHERIECYLNNGFYIGRGTLILVRKLDHVKTYDFSKPKYMDFQTEEGIETLEIKELTMEDDFLEEYERANGNAFVIPDSIGDLTFKMNGPDVKVFAVMKGKQIISSITIWECSEKRAATENIFCIDTYRRKGVTSALIEYVCAYLSSEGYEEASLSVYQDNLPAIHLYEKMGYRYEKLYLGLQYETGYTAVVY